MCNSLDFTEKNVMGFGKILHLVATCLSRLKILERVSFRITGQLDVEQQELRQCQGRRMCYGNETSA